jgi:HPt (histidine-containing phosphotransfer) domain-containing protein
MNNTIQTELKIFKDAVIPGLNIAEGLARICNDEESYLHILRTYVTHITNFIETARKEACGNLHEYRIAVHGIKGSCRGIGADELGLRAEELETAAKRKDIPFIQNNTGSFLLSVENFRAGMAAFIGNLDTQNSAAKPEMDEPDPALIKIILDACENYDIDTLKAAINKLEANSYSSAPGLAEWLHEQAGTSNFEKIKAHAKMKFRAI